MFSGIIERMALLRKKEGEGTNVHFTFESDLCPELKIDQSIAHNGVCLTVVDLTDATYTVTAIEETLNLSNLNDLKAGDQVNLERCVRATDRLDGHIVQGHVDGTGKVRSIINKDGSWAFTIVHGLDSRLILHKGSVTINGVSLTVTDSSEGQFSVAIIPYTFEHTNFHQLKVGDRVNLELDVIGKYVANLLPS